MYTYISTSDPTTNTTISLVGYALWVIALWPVFRKSGYPGWGALIPLYNVYVLVKIGGFSGWSILVFLIPIINIFWAIWVAVRVANAFGENGFFGFFLLFLLSPIGYFILGYGRARYRGPGGEFVPE